MSVSQIQSIASFFIKPQWQKRKINSNIDSGSVSQYFENEILL